MKTTNHKTGYLQINGTELYFEDTGGEGEPILFSHALLLDTKLFAPQVEHFKKKYRCISYDHRGQGKSAEVQDNSISLDLLCDDAVALIEKLQLGRVHFCGLSMGGFVGLRLAARYPQLLHSLILCSTSADAEPKENMLRYKFLNFVGRMLGPASVARPLVPIIYGKTTINDPDRVADKAFLIDHLSHNRRSIWQAVNGVIFRAGVLDELQKISAPTLVMVGEEDVCTVPEKSEQLTSSIKGAKLARISRSGHAITLEQPGVVNNLLEEFLEQVSPPGKATTAPEHKLNMISQPSDCFTPAPPVSESFSVS